MRLSPLLDLCKYYCKLENNFPFFLNDVMFIYYLYMLGDVQKEKSWKSLLLNGNDSLILI
jgi:hypothetical protein